MIPFFPPSVQPVSAWNVRWQWRHCCICSQSAGEGGHPPAQHTTLGGRHRGRFLNDITQTTSRVQPTSGLLHCVCWSILIADKWCRETGVQRATYCLPLWRSLWQCEADWGQFRESGSASHRGSFMMQHLGSNVVPILQQLKSFQKFKLISQLYIFKYMNKKRHLTAVLFFQNLQNSRGQQREFGDGQRDRQKDSAPTASEEHNVILSSIKNRGIQGQEFHTTH